MATQIKQMPRYCSGWCAPTIIYAIIVVVSIVATLIMRTSIQDKIKSIIIRTLIGSLWLAVIYLTCKYCYNTTAWFLALLPVLFGLLSLIFITSIMVAVRNKTRRRSRRR